MAVRQELWCSSVVPTSRGFHSKSAGYDKNRFASAARLFFEDSSSKNGGELVMEGSSVKSFRPKDHPSQKDPSWDSSICVNAVPSVMQRREVMKLCFFSGLFISELLQQNEAAVATEGDDEYGRVLLAPTEVGLENGRLRSCEGSAPCVSTSAFRSPSRFMPPWQYLGSQKDAYEELLKALKRMGAEIMEIKQGRYVYATISTSSSKEDIDDLEFLFVGKFVCFRSISRKTVLDPPFCWWPGCINGPRNRGRMEALRDDLGWIPLETDEDKAWTPIFLH